MTETNPEVTEQEIERLEAEVEQKRQRLKEARLQERFSEAREQLREIRDEAEENLETIDEAEREREEQAAVENDEAYFCDECDRFVEYKTKQYSNRREDNEWYDQNLCRRCYKDQRREEYKDELESLLGETFVVTNYHVDRHETDKARERGSIGVLHPELTIETESGDTFQLSSGYGGSDILRVTETGDDQPAE